MFPDYTTPSHASPKDLVPQYQTATPLRNTSVRCLGHLHWPHTEPKVPCGGPRVRDGPCHPLSSLFSNTPRPRPSGFLPSAPPPGGGLLTHLYRCRRPFPGGVPRHPAPPSPTASSLRIFHSAQHLFTWMRPVQHSPCACSVSSWPLGRRVPCSPALLFIFICLE